MGAPGLLATTSDPWVRWDWINRHWSLILKDTRQHLVLTGLAVGIGLVLAAGLALAARRWRALEAPILGFAGVVYTIPSLALFAFLVPWTGLTVTTAEIGLVGYTLLILVRNIVTGLDGVPEEVRDAARGMGYSPSRQLLRVELPLALPAIVAGIRIATVTTIGLVTVTALIGEGGLGSLINDGLGRDFHTPLVVGLAGSVILAVAADLVLVGVQRVLSPWAHRRRLAEQGAA
jgi:osmoprotectant transport system permease protein